VPLCTLLCALVGATGALSGAARAEDARPLDVDAFAFVVEPARIVLGETTEATVTITATDDLGAPLDVALPRLVASTGTLDAPVRTGPGVFRARFVPPKEAFPHVAVVSAVVDAPAATAVGFVSVPLWGKGATTVRTKANAQVTVFIGADAFGPVDAGASGAATVNIVVPPGPERAVAKSVDAVGNESQKTVDLGVPPFNRLAAFALDPIVTGDGSGRARILAVAVDNKGAPLVEAALKPNAGFGSFDDAVAIAPGLFELGWKPGKSAAGEAAVQLLLSGADKSRAKVPITLINGAPASVAFTLPTPTLTADDDRRMAVGVAVKDAGNNDVPFGAVRVDVDVGRIDGVDVTDRGATLAWVLPAELSGGAARTATLRARSSTGVVLGEAKVELVAGRIASLALAPLGEVVADGSRGVPVAVTAKDVAGNAVVPAGVTVTASAGRVVAGTVDVAAKRVTALYVPDARDEDAVVDVAAAVDVAGGVVRASRPLALRARPRAFLLVGPALTSTWNYGATAHVGGELSMLVRLPIADGSVHGGVVLGANETLLAPTALKLRQQRALPALVEVAWRPLLSKDLGLHVGAAAGVVVVDASQDRDSVDDSRIIARDQEELRVITPHVGGSASVGVAYRVGGGFVEVDARGGYAAPLSDPLFDIASLGVGLSIGYRFGL
jgi:hypothetical protein